MKNRKDGKRIKVNGMEQILIDLKPNRNEADVFIDKDIDVTELKQYLDKKKKEGKEYTFFHAVVLAIGKVIYNRNKLNRFVANRHLYEHNNIVISFVAKVSFDDKSEEVMLLIPIDEKDNLDTISKKIKDKVDAVRVKKVDKKGANSAIDTLGKLPNIIRVPLIGLLKRLDQLDLLPESLKQDNLYYSSTIVSNIGSLGSEAIYHNNTNLGTASSILTIGKIKDKEVITENGKKEIRKICDFGMNFDERIADGFYLIKSAKLLQHIVSNPELLEEDANTKIELPE